MEDHPVLEEVTRHSRLFLARNNLLNYVPQMDIDFCAIWDRDGMMASQWYLE
jgi:hypothetical protein